MGKKTTTKKTTTTKRAAAKIAAPVVFTNQVPAPATVTKPKRAKATKPAAAKKAAAPKTTKTTRTRKPAAIAAGFTMEDIGLRAYFIAEKRQQCGQHGTPEGDWLEAERQLRAELAV